MIVDGLELAPEESEKDGHRGWLFVLPESLSIPTEPVEIAYEFEVTLKRERRTPLVFFNLASPARGARFGFDFAQTDIEVVEPTVFCPSTVPPRTLRRPAAGRTTSITVEVDGWLPPGSGVVFSWENPPPAP